MVITTIAVLLLLQFIHLHNSPSLMSSWVVMFVKESSSILLFPIARYTGIKLNLWMVRKRKICPRYNIYLYLLLSVYNMKKCWLASMDKNMSEDEEEYWKSSGHYH